jgi:hypothetical protein
MRGSETQSLNFHGRHKWRGACIHVLRDIGLGVNWKENMPMVGQSESCRISQVDLAEGSEWPDEKRFTRGSVDTPRHCRSEANKVRPDRACSISLISYLLLPHSCSKKCGVSRFVRWDWVK